MHTLQSETFINMEVHTRKKIMQASLIYVACKQDVCHLKALE